MRTLFHQRLEYVLLEMLTVVVVPVILLGILLESVYHRKFVMIALLIAVLALVF